MPVCHLSACVLCPAGRGGKRAQSPRTQHPVVPRRRRGPLRRPAAALRAPSEFHWKRLVVRPHAFSWILGACESWAGSPTHEQTHTHLDGEETAAGLTAHIRLWQKPSIPACTGCTAQLLSAVLSSSVMTSSAPTMSQERQRSSLGASQENVQTSCFLLFSQAALESSSLVGWCDIWSELILIGRWGNRSVS
ncbi:unnamed protein product [Pleuronectes platessa]|uniref:Uncharacterized protein n=1 Tax=Pleuronectes platessa TaxID=8262 RepID=A0A9N7UNP8_PLEPL|nr:unnamed protein product [Pleuronectes platessa]